MARIKLKGLNFVDRHRADGRVERVWYLRHARGVPGWTGRRGSPEFVTGYMAALDQMKASKAAPKKEETLSDLFDLYLDSQYFREKAEATRKDYRREIEETRSKFGWVALSLLATKGVRRDLYAHREVLAKKSTRKADKFWVTMGIVLGWGVSSGICDHNPCTKGGRFHHGSRIEQVWPFEVEEAFYAGAPRHLSEMLLAGIWTGQRETDLIELTWFQYDGAAIRLEQNKTKTRVVIPVGGPLKAVLDEKRERLQPKPGDRVFLTAKRGTPWKDGNAFYSSFRKWMARLEIEGLTFNDTRGTAVTRLAMAGCSVPEIAAITGHSLKDAQAILDAHYLNRDPALARSAIAKMEAFWAAQGRTAEPFSGGAAAGSGGNGKGSILPLAMPRNHGENDAEEDKRGTKSATLFATHAKSV